MYLDAYHAKTIMTMAVIRNWYRMYPLSVIQLSEPWNTYSSTNPGTSMPIPMNGLRPLTTAQL